MELSRHEWFMKEGGSHFSVPVGVGSVGGAWEGHLVRICIMNRLSIVNGRISDKTKPFITGLQWVGPEPTATDAGPDDKTQTPNGFAEPVPIGDAK